MINRIDLFMPPVSQYGVLHDFTKEMYAALQRKGIEGRLLVADRHNPKPFLETLFGNPPDCTLSFNGLLPDKEGRFFCELVKIPHVACVVDSPSHFLTLTQSDMNVITCPDRFFVEFFKGVGFDQVFFLPQGVNPGLEPPGDVKREYDVLFLASCIDYESRRKIWDEKFPPQLCKVLDETAEAALSEPGLSYTEALVNALNKQAESKEAIDPRTINYLHILDELERFMRGKDRIELVRSIRDANVHIFGSPGEGKGWDAYVKEQKNVTLHSPVPFEEAIELMGKSKVVLNSSPHMKNGGHERIFTALASEACVVTNDNLYLREDFSEECGIHYFTQSILGKVNDRINEWLADESLRLNAAAKGRKIAMERHTWDNRAEELIAQLTPMLKKVKSS